MTLEAMVQTLLLYKYSTPSCIPLYTAFTTLVASALTGPAFWTVISKPKPPAVGQLVPQDFAGHQLLISPRNIGGW
jgi:hypothetical protein